MARTCPVGFDVTRLREQVSATYERVAHAPDGEFHFHRGMDYACELLGYDRAELERLPAETVAAFAGVANPLRIGPIAPGERVLDIGCGAGTDRLLAALRTGPTGRALGVDMTPAMRARAAVSAAAMGVADVVDVRPGTAEALPVDDAGIDVVISNGVINLSPDKDQAFSEIWRVLAPGGRLYLGDVIVSRELSLAAQRRRSLGGLNRGRSAGGRATRAHGRARLRRRPHRRALRLFPRHLGPGQGVQRPATARRQLLRPQAWPKLWPKKNPGPAGPVGMQSGGAGPSPSSAT
jgi:arsenite methyltransferase